MLKRHEKQIETVVNFIDASVRAKIAEAEVERLKGEVKFLKDLLLKTPNKEGE